MCYQKQSRLFKLKKNSLHVRRLIFSRLFNIVATKPHTLFGALQLGPKGGGERFFGELGGHPILGLLKVFLGQEAASQLFLHLGEEEEGGRGQPWQIGGLF